jgi:FkbM family methyltransferase
MASFVEKDSIIHNIEEILSVDFLNKQYDLFINRIQNLKKSKKISIYGAGGWGLELSRILNYLEVPIEYFIDKNAENIKCMDDLPVISPNDLKVYDCNRENTVVFIATRVEHITDITSFLKEMGYTLIYSLNGFWNYSHWFEFNQLEKINIQKENIIKASNYFDDAESLITYYEILKNYITQTYETDKKILRNEQYFPKDIFLTKGYSRFVDCGAFDGDTVVGLIENNIEVEKVALFEPAQENLDLIGKNRILIENNFIDKIKIFPYGLWSEKKELSFYSGRGTSCKISNEGNNKIQCVTLDDSLKEFKPTFIKMDIEGAELEALIGGKKLIRHEKPDLAISVYHKIEHLWEVLLYLHELNLGYKFYLRSYENYNQESVLYATVSAT